MSAPIWGKEHHLDIAQRRACAGALTAALVAFGTLWASPAQAATCQTVPASTIGTDVGVAGQEHRVPAISGITVCVDAPVVPLVTTSTSGNGNCTSGCLSVLTTGGDVSSGSVTVSYKADGVTQSRTASGGSLGGPSGSCLLSVGSPDAPYPACFVSLGPDEIPDLGPTVDELREDAEDAADNLPDAGSIAAETIGLILDTVPDDPVGEVPVEEACDLIPTARDRWGNSIEFCDNPGQWATLTAENAAATATETADEDVCPLIPTARDEWGNVISFCDNPGQWATSMAENAVETAGETVADAETRACNAVPDESDENGSVRFCDNPAQWIGAWTQSTFHPVISACEQIDCATLPERVVELVCEIRPTAACR